MTVEVNHRAASFIDQNGRRKTLSEAQINALKWILLRGKLVSNTDSRWYFPHGNTLTALKRHGITTFDRAWSMPNSSYTYGYGLSDLEIEERAYAYFCKCFTDKGIKLVKNVFGVDPAPVEEVEWA